MSEGLRPNANLLSIGHWVKLVMEIPSLRCMVMAAGPSGCKILTPFSLRGHRLRSQPAVESRSLQTCTCCVVVLETSLCCLANWRLHFHQNPISRKQKESIHEVASCPNFGPSRIETTGLLFILPAVSMLAAVISNCHLLLTAIEPLAA